MYTTKDAFLHPLLYLGTKPEQYDETPRPIRFVADPRFDAPMAWVTEEEGRRLIRRASGLYKWAYAQPSEWLDKIPDEGPKRSRKRVEVA